MTENEAIREVRFNMSTIGLSDKAAKRVVEARNMAIKALEKQIPKKPIFNHNLSDTLSVFHCECGNVIKVSHDVGIMDNNNAPNYCSKCGCRLDWRLIDADNLNFQEQYYNKSQMKAILDFVDNQPTVYDIDRVAERLKTDSSVRLYGSGNSNNYLIPLEKAIEIVKAGGNS